MSRDATHPSILLDLGREAVPDLDDVAGEWIDAAELEHLPSLRNQRGQGHVNHDLASLSWLASPPYSFGYHTGLLRLDGAVLPAQRFRWKPWGVRREYHDDDVSLCTDTRMALSRDLLLWRIDITNGSSRSVVRTISQELFAPVAHSEVGWGWLYDVPWSSGNYHDFITLERIRESTWPGADASSYLFGPGPRRIRLGRPRLPGIQRDEDASPMRIERELPRHVSLDAAVSQYGSVSGSIRNARCLDAATGTEVFSWSGPLELRSDSRVDLGVFELRDGLVFSFDFLPAMLDQTGVILTHGNHPDSLQFGLDDDCLWMSIAGEKAYAARSLTAGAWNRIAAVTSRGTVQALLDGQIVAATRHWSMSDRWAATLQEDSIRISDLRSGARAAYAFGCAPSEMRLKGIGGEASWSLALAPGETRSLGIACAFGTDQSAAVVDALEAAVNLDARCAETEAGFRRLWQSMFTPGNDDFSGHLPTLTTDDPGLAKAYYMGALTVLYMRNLTASPTEPTFPTGGPRLGPTTTFFWDHAEWSRMYALLEPRGLKSWLRRALQIPHGDAFGFDVRNGSPLGNRYAANDYALFRLIEHYVGVTGDLAFLDEMVGSKTVIEHLTECAYGWEARRSAATGGELADFGPDAWQLLECVPNYIHVVASFNAAYAGMMRSLSALFASRGCHERAAQADAQAQRLVEGVLDLYVPGGRWVVRHPEGDQTIGHCLDFGLVSAALHGDLSDQQRREMVAFVEEHLVAGSWMRALAADDPIAAVSDRPDHGARGAFCAWPGVTAYGLAKLGRRDLAVELLRRLPRSASGALWGQAMEIVVDAAGVTHIRVAGRAAANRDSIAGAATAEAVISGLFGVDPRFAALGKDAPPTTAFAEDVGILSNINVRSAIARRRN